MKYFLVLFALGVLCQNTLARGLNNPVLDDFERRLVRLESRQFSESENLEHRMLQLETKLGTQKEDESPEKSQLERNFYEISNVEKPSESVTFLKRLEKVEQNWEKELEEELEKFSSKYDHLSKRFSAIEQHLDQHKLTTFGKVMERLSPVSDESKSEESEENITDKFQKIGAKSYYIENNEKATWLDAIEKCQEMNAHLVSLQDEDEWSNLKEALAEAHSYWTDINDRAEEVVFVSKTSGRRAPFLRWDDNEPNSVPGVEDCVELRADHDYKMNDVNCDEKRYYICES